MLKEKREQNRAPGKRLGALDGVIRFFSSFFSDRSVWIPTVVIVVMLAAIIGIGLEVICLRDRVASAEEKLAALGLTTQELQPGWVDSSFPDVQPLGLGFSLVDLKAEPVDTGVRVTGAVINGGSLDHYDAVFMITFDENRRTKVTIPALAAGHSAAFDAIVGPATEKSVPEKIRVLFAGSTVSYY